MKLLMDRLQTFGVNVCVDLSCGDIGMSKHFLDNAQRRAVGQEMGGERVT